ncbi:DUF4436 family protein [Streptomyces nojiriensis]|uniref:DUF4436 family protein n=1 Tax=Streptomyces nojiriensis TaxID=66374 RepID=UPI0035D7668A
MAPVRGQALDTVYTAGRADRDRTWPRCRDTGVRPVHGAPLRHAMYGTGRRGLGRQDPKETAQMAATLFALAAFRNTAPGSPPIGCLLDYIAFLWAETVIAFCPITVVITGIRAEPPATAPTDTP